MLARYGLDAARDLLPVAPALHYAMGGIQTDLEGRASMPGLWAVGEVASTGVHGANRLASNSLLEGLVFADRAGRSVAAARPDASRTPACRRRVRGRATPAPTTAASRNPAGDARADDRRCRRAAHRILAAPRRAGARRGSRGQTPAGAWRTENQLLVARLITQAARRRRESRGGHRRLDYPPAALKRETA